MMNETHYNIGTECTNHSKDEYTAVEVLPRGEVNEKDKKGKIHKRGKRRKRLHEK
jgi:hypothetical protein